MSKPNYYFVNLAKSKAAGSTLQELRDQKEKESKKGKKGKKDPIDKIYGKSKPYVNPNQKILLNTHSRLVDTMRENNRTKILMDLEFNP